MYGDGSEDPRDGGQPSVSAAGQPPEPPEPPPMWPSPSGAGPPGGMRRRTAVAAIVAVVLVVAAVGIPVALLNRGSQVKPQGGTSPTAGTSPTPEAASSAVAVYQKALAATRAAVGCHYVGVTTGGGANERIIGDAGPSGGSQVITFDSNYGAEQFTLLLASGTVYFQGNTPALQDQLGVPAAAAPGLQGQWISVASGDGPYNVLEPGITVADQAKQLALVPTAASAVKTSGGTAATRILGTVPPQNGAPAGTGHLDVAASSNLPITYVSTASGNAVTLTSTTTFSGWGTPPTIAIPSGAVSWSTLGASQPPGGYGGGGSGPSPTSTPLAV